MTLKAIIACVTCLITGLLIGYMMPSRIDSSTETAGGATPDSSDRRSSRRGPSGGSSSGESRSASRVGDTQDVGALADESGLVNPSQYGPLVVVPASMIDAMSRSGGVRSTSQDLFSKDGKQEAYLQINDREKASLQRAWRQVQAKVKKLESDSAQSEDLPNGSVRITVPDLTSGIGELGGDFQSSVTEVLGSNRGGAFLAMKQIDGMFSPEAGAQTYTVRMEATGDGRWRYHMSYQGPGGRKAWVGDRVPAAIRHLTDSAKIQANLNPPDPEDDDE